MLELSELKLAVDHVEEDLYMAVARALRVVPQAVTKVGVYRRAVDARHGKVSLNYTVHVEVTDEEEAMRQHDPALARVSPVPERNYKGLPEITQGRRLPAQRPVIVGTGPCGLFCALILARAGWRPIVLERGKQAGPRARDVTGFWRRGLELDPDSNVQFGEGGAGTFSDGKLYTQIKDRDHRIPWLLREMVKAGAPEDILVKARPHIGTDRLITVVRHVREEIISLGGDLRYSTTLTGLLKDAAGAVRGVELSTGGEIAAERVVIAIGHSARDTFSMLYEAGVCMEAKSLSIGVRIEHPQGLIDQTQYGRWAGQQRLGAAPYKFVHHSRNGRAAYSFCMCPGGLVVAASSEPGGVVTNGMSSYARAEANANAGFMVDISPDDYAHAGGSGPLAGIDFQRLWERRAFIEGGRNYYAPVQTSGDFLARRATGVLGSVVPSYQPGVTPCDLHALMPAYVTETLREAIPAIERQLRGFAHPEAVLRAVETRSSSPLRMTRHPETFHSISTPGLYPAGEGAGYAGGIISAAVDGMRIAEALLREL